MVELCPCLLERKIVPKPWGGRALESVLGLELPPGEAVGETWELFDAPEEASRLRGSAATVADLMKPAHRVRLLGAGVEPTPGGRFPLAVKFVDAAQALSVQVHPDDDQAAEDGQCGKAEAWVVLHTGPEAAIRRGLRAGVTRTDFVGVADTEKVLDLLETFAPQKGDAIHVPPGTVHAIGPDVVVFEIQRNSTLTFRLYDWGRDRETHLQQALQAARFDAEPQTTVSPEPAPGEGEWLIRDPHFRVRRIAPTSAFNLPTEGTFKLVTLLQGRCSLGWRSGGSREPLHLVAGDTALVPAVTEDVFVSPVGVVDVLVSDPGAAH